MYCTKCGAKVSEDDHFCAKCGASLKKETKQESESSSAPEMNPAPSQVKKPVKGKNLTVVAVTAIILVAAVTLASLWFFRFRKEDGGLLAEAAMTETSHIPEDSRKEEAGIGDQPSAESVEESSIQAETEETTEEAIETAATATTEPEENIDLLSAYNAHIYTPFYGIWISATKDETAARRTDYNLEAIGYEGSCIEIVKTTDWSNLNPEPWYVTSIGTYQTEADAKAELAQVQTIYPSAYVKYSGDYIGHNDTITYVVSSEDDIIETDNGYAIKTPLWGESNQYVRLQIDEQTKIVPGSLEEYEEGDNGLTWYKRNLERSKSTDSYESSMALMGVFQVRVTGYHVDEICGCYWWD